ncbi:MAG: hypothetical protein OXC07_04100 [Kistimonas sp.]|nr:hypothetical protein [Kistimonas sp.]
MTSEDGGSSPTPLAGFPQIAFAQAGFTPLRVVVRLIFPLHPGAGVSASYNCPHFISFSGVTGLELLQHHQTASFLPVVLLASLMAGFFVAGKEPRPSSSGMAFALFSAIR